MVLTQHRIASSIDSIARIQKRSWTAMECLIAPPPTAAPPRKPNEAKVNMAGKDPEGAKRKGKGKAQTKDKADKDGAVPQGATKKPKKASNKPKADVARGQSKPVKRVEKVLGDAEHE